MKTKTKYQRYITPTINLTDKYAVYPEDTSLSNLLLRWSSGVPMGDQITKGNYITGYPVKPSSDMTDIDRTVRLVQILKNQYENNKQQLDDLTKSLQQVQQTQQTETNNINQQSPS